MQAIKLLIATTNAGKVRELAGLLAGLPFEVIGLREVGRDIPVVEETGLTFGENALLKAKYYHRMTGLLSLADDSGLEVDYLDGAPGIYSARFAGEDASDDDRVSLLLEKLEGVPPAQRTARFCCSIAISGTGPEGPFSRVFDATSEGQISTERRGMGGFGYDPVFIDPESGHTYAELSREIKSSISHRGKASSMATRFLEEKVRKWETNP